jgi:hypothetical protein
MKGTCHGVHNSVKAGKLLDATVENIASLMHPTNLLLNPIELMLLRHLKAASDGFKYNRYWGEV